ncbi:MAG: peptide chain release factor N(5)-glutamine methyltransferase [Myxococcales bacterium]|nr:peptide chain release factor N(5)-glutamine methyltransferase [Myxococcales bacterium]
MADDVWTLQALLAWTRGWLEKHGSPTARLDGELLLCAVLGCRRLDLMLRFDQPVQKDELARFKALIQRRAKGEPVAYILGRREFYGLDLEVDRRVLVPRPETESLVDCVLGWLKGAVAVPGDVLDLGTGSGAIALAVADALGTTGSERKVLATDRDADALSVARANAERLGLAVRIDFVHADLWQGVVPARRFAVVASNPPYVRSSTLPQLARDVRDFEPPVALDGGLDGLDVLRRIAAQTREYLVPGGLLVVELGDAVQAREMTRLLAAGGLDGARTESVMGGPTALVRVEAPLQVGSPRVGSLDADSPAG